MRPDPDALARLAGAAPTAVLPLHGDGSGRRFFRVRAGEHRFVLLVGHDPAENSAYVRIARHLEGHGVRVPRIRGVDESKGWILLEDLGDRNLLSAVAEGRGEAEILALYGPVIDLLCRMQVCAAEGFELSTGFAPAPYGPDLMVEWEGMYFGREFAAGLLGLDVPAAFRQDVERLANDAVRAPGGYFLHRDFQSRNIHLVEGGPAVIDFQGARPGPLAYDAAALILDPYAGHPAPLRRALLRQYLRRLGSFSGVDVTAVEGSWFSLGAFRLLQALGAFGKLGGRLGKPGFLEHAAKALSTLSQHLGERGRAEYPVLWRLVLQCRERWEGREAAKGDRLPARHNTP